MMYTDFMYLLGGSYRFPNKEFALKNVVVILNEAFYELVNPLCPYISNTEVVW